MHTAAEFQPEHSGWEARLIRANPFATFVSTGSPEPGSSGIQVSHLPMVLDGDPGDGTEPDLQGRTLLGHMARTGPQWPALLRDPIATAIFRGPHGYVSPAVRGDAPPAPAWNYTAAHVRGRVRLLHEADDVLRVLTETTAVGEAGRARPDGSGPPLDAFRALLPHVIAFSMRITSVESLVELGQGDPADLRDKVRADLAASPRGCDRDLAAVLAGTAAATG
ncbi:PaiB family negative transcriptional regulator [Murinocardiopsis flavida]|uniref:PaiB family negative transcriptional regulator n=2 Tax=Murinocardiopsis flavida TaxID=645275 RepID=A0A2P8DPC7_9ACTN|nr:PaiB family negative transcriptional regulator [Murinocardiopsis flavida]